MADSEFTPQELESEQWRPLPYQPFGSKYSVSNLGRVKPNEISRYSNNKTPILKATPNSRGYLHVEVYAQGQRMTVFIHKAVTFAFHGPPPDDKPYACHKDDCQRNNRTTNLYWGDEPDNHRDRQRNKRDLIGERHGRAVFTEKDIKKIRGLYKEGKHTQVELAKMFKTKQTYISRITLGKVWRHL